jgi:hypothetical protein
MKDFNTAYLIYNSAFLGYNTAIGGHFLPTFLYNLWVSSLGIKHPKKGKMDS